MVRSALARGISHASGQRQFPLALHPLHRIIQLSSGAAGNVIAARLARWFEMIG